MTHTIIDTHRQMRPDMRLGSPGRLPPNFSCQKASFACPNVDRVSFALNRK